MNGVSEKKLKNYVLLWALAGIFGLHQFYAGRKTPGYVRLFTFSAFGILWLYDGYIMFVKQPDDNNGYKISNWE